MIMIVIHWYHNNRSVSSFFTTFSGGKATVSSLKGYHHLYDITCVLCYVTLLCINDLSTWNPWHVPFGPGVHGIVFRGVLDIHRLHDLP